MRHAESLAHTAKVDRHRKPVDFFRSVRGVWCVPYVDIVLFLFLIFQFSVDTEERTHHTLRTPLQGLLFSPGGNGQHTNMENDARGSRSSTQHAAQSEVGARTPLTAHFPSQ